MNQRITTDRSQYKDGNPMDRAAFLAMAKRAYGWTVMWNGEAAGLVAGDMGYDGAGVNLGVLVAHALGETSATPVADQITEKLEALVEACRDALAGGNT